MVKIKKGEIKLNDDSWTKEKDKILLKSNGCSIHDIELKLNELIKSNWRFIGNPRVYINPPISVKTTEKQKIVEILKSNNLLLLPRGF
jgi:hypothetical protein